LIDDRCADGVSIALFRAQKMTPKYGAKGTTEKHTLTGMPAARKIVWWPVLKSGM